MGLRKASGGEPADRYADQLELYRNFEFKPFLLDRGAVEAASAWREQIEVPPPRSFPRLRTALGL